MEITQNKSSLRKILVICFTLISAVPVLLLALWIQQSAVEKEFEAVQEKHLIIAKNLTGAIERYIDDAKFAFKAAVTEKNTNSVHNSEINALLENLNFIQIWMVSGQNYNQIYQNENPLDVAEDVRLFISDVKKMSDDDIHISGILANSLNQPTIAMAYRMSKDKYVVGTISPKYILKVQSAIVFGDRGHAAIVDQFGRVMAHPVEGWYKSRKDISFLPPVQKMMKGVTGVTQFYTPAMQADMIAGHTVVKNTGWGVMIPQPVSELYDRAAYAKNMSIFIAFTGVCIAAFISIWLAGYITRSLNSVTKFTETVASGELNTRLVLEKGLIPQELNSLVSSFNRMTEKLKSKTEEFSFVNDRLREAQHIAKLGNWKLNILDNTMWWSDEVYRIFNVNKNDVASPTLDIMLSLMEGEQKTLFVERLKESILTKLPFSIDCKKIISDNKIVYYHQDVVVQIDDNNEISYLSGTIQDVTERKIQEQELIFQAKYDSLTLLPNRDHCLEILENDINEAQIENRILPFILIGMDHFKEVNGSLGHDVGDKLMIIAVKKIESLLSKNDFIARLGSVEFAVILNSATDMEKVDLFANEVIAEFQGPISVNSYEVTIGASVGVSVYPEFAEQAISLVQKAGTALHAAKERGHGTYCLFNSEMDERVVSKMHMRSDLSTALESEQFHLVFQPIVDSKTSKVICAESLIRWIHPTRGFIPPDQFISIAEESGYISEIGLWVIDEACKELKKWHNNGFPDLYISVNLSLRQIQLGLKKEQILEILNKYSLETHFLTLEITESLLMEDLANNQKWLNDVSSAGIKFSIDDFGTGYSSLSYLLNLPVSTLKIDRAFVSNILLGEKDETLIEMIIALSKKLGYKVVAEGVETEGQLGKLNEFNCDLIQGYFFSKPLKSNEFIEYIENAPK